MKAIYWKEMRQYFHSVIGYVFLAIFVLINSYYFFLQNLLNRSGDITDYFQSTITIMMFLMPMLTMRSFSEEKKQRTDMLLLTMPIRREDIVLGKFFAAESVFLLGLAVTLVFPAILALCGSAQLWITVGNYIGIILLMSVFSCHFFDDANLVFYFISAKLFITFARFLHAIIDSPRTPITFLYE